MIKVGIEYFSKFFINIFSSNFRMVVKAYGKYGSSGKSFKYWYADSMELTYSYNNEQKVSRISPGYIAAPQDNSYACQRPDNQPWAGATANLIFTNLQVLYLLMLSASSSQCEILPSEEVNLIESHFAYTIKICLDRE